MQSSVKKWPERIQWDDYAANIGHVSRYKFASRFVQDKIVLDLACGVGYGTYLLSTSGARKVVGIDIDISAIAQTQTILSQNILNRVDFLAGSGTGIPLPNQSMQVIISFETIEHIHEAEGFLSEFERVLKDDGLLILSTPNALVTQPVNGIPRNPYHVKEFTPLELKTFLSRFFPEVELLGQRMRHTTSPHDPKRHFLYPLISLFPLRWRQSFSRRIPRSIADSVVLRITGHNAVLRSEDIEIKADNIESASVIVALCRKKQPTAEMTELTRENCP